LVGGVEIEGEGNEGEFEIQEDVVEEQDCRKCRLCGGIIKRSVRRSMR
jgi:hypothetical protein